MKKQQLKSEPYMMNRELSWLKFNERVLNEAGNPAVPLAERLTFASIYQSNLDEFYRVRVGTLMDQMESKEVVRENKTNMTSEQQVKAILQETRDLDQKKAAIYEQLMGELEPKGIRLINFNKLSAEEGKLLETYFDNEIAPYLSANIVSKQQPFPFLKNKDIYAVALLETKGGKTRAAIIPCSNNVLPSDRHPDQKGNLYALRGADSALPSEDVQKLCCKRKIPDPCNAECRYRYRDDLR